MNTRKGKSDFMAALDDLIKAEYIHWADKSDTRNFVILEGWERESEKPKIQPQKCPIKNKYGLLDYIGIKD